MKIVNTNDVLLRGKQRYQVIIADDNIFVICKEKYLKREQCVRTYYNSPEVYSNDSSINTLEELHFSIMNKTDIKNNDNKYRKKPVVIEAVQYDGFHTGYLNEFCGDKIKEPVGELPFICTLEGNMKISKGDFVIKGVNGEFYPCKPDIFEKTYEKV